jgi:hypothetical protein
MSTGPAREQPATTSSPARSGQRSSRRWSTWLHGTLRNARAGGGHRVWQCFALAHPPPSAGPTSLSCLIRRRASSSSRRMRAAGMALVGASENHKGPPGVRHLHQRGQARRKRHSLDWWADRRSEKRRLRGPLTQGRRVGYRSLSFRSADNVPTTVLLSAARTAAEGPNRSERLPGTLGQPRDVRAYASWGCGR